MLFVHDRVQGSIFTENIFNPRSRKFGVSVVVVVPDADGARRLVERELLRLDHVLDGDEHVVVRDVEPAHALADLAAVVDGPDRPVDAPHGLGGRRGLGRLGPGLGHLRAQREVERFKLLQR